MVKTKTKVDKWNVIKVDNLEEVKNPKKDPKKGKGKTERAKNYLMKGAI